MTAFTSHRLVDLFGEWVVRDGRHVGVKFCCPSCPAVEGAVTLAVLFANPVDGAPWPDDPQCVGNNDGKRWTRTGDTLETLTLSPSINCEACGHWHGVVADGIAP